MTKTQSEDQSIKKIVTSKDMENVTRAINKEEITQPLVAVYCGSRVGNNKIYQQSAHRLGKMLAKNGFGLVYGGASIGLMGAVADGVIEGGAQTVGVIPKFMLEHEIAHQNLTQLHLTDTMHTRKAIMAEYADAFVTLPGGLGTLEEIMEIATWRQLYQHIKPMIILNINGYYDRLIDHLQFTTEQGFMKPEDLQRLVVCNDIHSTVELIKSTINIDSAVDIHKL